MKFFCADFAFPLLPHGCALQLIKLLGIDAVDLGIFEDRSHNYPSQVCADPEGEAKRIGAALLAADLSVADVFLQTGAEPNIAAANSPSHQVRESNRDTFRRMLEFTLSTGGRRLTGLPGVRHDGESANEDWERAVSECAWRVENATSAGVAYSVEPHVGSILSDPGETLRFLRDVPGLTLTLDYGHFVYQGMNSVDVHPLCEHASHFHARGGAPGKLQTPVTENAIDFVAATRALRDSGYDGYICLEYVWVNWEGCNRTDNVSETVLLKQQLERLMQ